MSSFAASDVRSARSSGSCRLAASRGLFTKLRALLRLLPALFGLPPTLPTLFGLLSTLFGLLPTLFGLLLALFELLPALFGLLPALFGLLPELLFMVVGTAILGPLVMLSGKLSFFLFGGSLLTGLFAARSASIVPGFAFWASLVYGWIAWGWILPAG